GFVAWTDTRQGNQDIYFSRFSLNPAPSPPNDRFEPNETAAAATALGQVVKVHLPRLHLAAGDDDWFSFSSLATGQLKIVAQASDTTNMQLQVFDSSGTNLLAEGTELRDGAGNPIGKQIVAAAQSGQSYLLRIHSVAAGSSNTSYALDVQALTAELGP